MQWPRFSSNSDTSFRFLSSEVSSPTAGTTIGRGLVFVEYITAGDCCPRAGACCPPGACVENPTTAIGRKKAKEGTHRSLEIFDGSTSAEILQTTLSSARTFLHSLHPGLASLLWCSDTTSRPQGRES
mmetsp:Transcript_8353/g.27366  ORF Transcript_8353/g.27366 Transcript_8353/m.27366 type:complete len:128 (+) Transcript_8353:1545-1928(+)